MDLQALNEKLSKATPKEIISYALSIAKKPIITTNFSSFSASILHAVVTEQPDIDVVWVDTGYNTPQTYKYAVNLIERLRLNIHSYVPKQSVAHRNVVLGIPTIDDPKHAEFTQQVKLEPFKRAMDIHQPDVWFTNLRKGQTAFRNSIDVLSYSKDGVLKVSPFYHYSDEEVQAYLDTYDLPNEARYFDPTKQFANRECGLHA